MTTPRESLWTVAPEDRPRERLERLGPGGLSDSELVALVLGSGMPGVNVLDSARSLLAQAGGVTELMTMTVRELRALMGVGVATAGRVVAVAELWRRANHPPPGAVLEHPADVVEAVRAHLAARRTGPSARSGAPGPPGPPADCSAGSAVGAPEDEAWASTGSPPGPALFVVVADTELRLRVVVPLTGVDTTSLVSGVLHEVLYRGGAAFAVAVAEAPQSGIDDAQLGAVRDVLKLAAATVGLRHLSTVRLTGAGWSTHG